VTERIPSSTSLNCANREFPTREPAGPLAAILDWGLKEDEERKRVDRNRTVEDQDREDWKARRRCVVGVVAWMGWEVGLALSW